MSQTLQNRINEKQNHIIELDDIYALIDTSRLALKAEGSDEAACAITVLGMATNNLYMEIQKEKKELQALEAEQQGGEE